MTKQERDAEIVRLLPYAVSYAKTFVSKDRTTKQRDVDELFGVAREVLVRCVDSGKPAKYLKRAVEWALLNWRRRERKKYREAPFSDFDDDAGLNDGNARELSFDFTAAEDADRAELFLEFHVAVMRATHSYAFRLRAALRANLLQQQTGAWRETGYSHEAFYIYRRRVFEEIRNNRKIAARFYDSYK